MVPEPLPACGLRRVGTRLVWLALVLLAPAPAGAQDRFGDQGSFGRGVDSRREHSGVASGGVGFDMEPQKVGGIFTPHLFGSGTLGWSDNFLLEDGDAAGVDPVDDPFLRAEAGGRADFDLGDHLAEAEYRIRPGQTLGGSDFSTLEHETRLRLDLFFNDLDAHVDGGWIRSEFPQSIQLRGIVRLDTYYVNGFGRLQFNRFSVRLGGGFARLDYQEPELQAQDNRQYNGDIQLSFDLFPRLRLLVEYGLVSVIFDEGDGGVLNDYLAHTIRAGVDGEISPKLTGSFKLGVTVQDVDENAVADDREYTGFNLATSLRWEVLAERLNWSLSYTRDLQVSLSSNGLVSDSVTSTVAYTLPAASRPLTTSLTLGFDYVNVDRGEDQSRGRASLNVFWQLQDWLGVSAAYEFQALQADPPGADFVVNTVTLTLGVGF